MSALHALVDRMADEHLAALALIKDLSMIELKLRIAFANRSIGQRRRQWRAKRVAKDFQRGREA